MLSISLAANAAIVNAGHDASAAYAAIAAILGPGIPIVAWLIVTYSYRQDKIMIIREVGKNVTEAELGGKASSSTSERGMSRLLSSRQNSETPLIVNNPLAAEQPRAEAAPPPPDVQTAARKIAARCLRRWDAFLGFRAGRDGLGNPLGVWKTKFDGVRFAVLLLAMRKLNQHLQLQQETSAPGQTLSSVIKACHTHAFSMQGIMRTCNLLHFQTTSFAACICM